MVPLVVERVTPAVALVSSVTLVLLITAHSVPRGIPVVIESMLRRKLHPKHSGWSRLWRGMGVEFVIKIRLGSSQRL